ncbi:putative ATP-binding component of ABC transporter [Carbonactinospora thermoautotrophica]|uniref:ABC-type quaternary amine transporter n=2 Tax=Carbonactinospora thermoautotrophica TaxID=1469144 RepID=A0A132MWE8_9ACTN|nr:putative ATP-binding component of ABC transporter [Carbonactinospora thermoautotrophica]
MTLHAQPLGDMTRQAQPVGDMTLHAQLRVERPGFVLDLELGVGAGEVVALLGPNGAGKTTVLRALAGLIPLTRGRVILDGQLLEDTATGARVPTERRSVGVVFQDYLLFPHLTALDNVAFGLRCHGHSRAAAHQKAAAWLRRVGLADHAHTRPRQLSGGQAQRVALARALAIEPRLLLLDEPLAALDAHTRLEIRSQLRHHLADYSGATLLVTHDPLDAMVLADRLAVIENGRLVQHGTPEEIARRPRTDYVARLVGLNLYRGRAHRHTVTLDGGVQLTVTEDLTGPVFVAFPPAAVALYRTRPDGSPRNLWPATVTGMERHGDQVRVHLDGPLRAAADVTAAAVAELHLTPGQQVWVSVKAAETHAYPV